MIHPQDEDSLIRMSGLNTLPSEIQDEYEVWLGMYHRDGNSGPMGSIGCIALLRSLGYAPPFVQNKVETVDWRDYPTDGSVKVEANFFGGWQPGTFLGFVEAGTLAIRLDNDEVVRECQPNVVRLAAGDVFEDDPLSTEEEDDFVIDLTGDDEPDAAEAEGEVIQKTEVASSSE